MSRWSFEISIPIAVIFMGAPKGLILAKCGLRGPGNCSSYFRTELATTALWRFLEPGHIRSASSGGCTKYRGWTTDGTYKRAQSAQNELETPLNLYVLHDLRGKCPNVARFYLAWKTNSDHPKYFPEI